MNLKNMGSQVSSNSAVVAPFCHVPSGQSRLDLNPSVSRLIFVKYGRSLIILAKISFQQLNATNFEIIVLQHGKKKGKHSILHQRQLLSSSCKMSAKGRTWKRSASQQSHLGTLPKIAVGPPELMPRNIGPLPNENCGKGPVEGSKL